MTFSLPGDGNGSYTLDGGIYVPSGEGITKWFSGDVYTVKLRAEQTNGTLGLIEASVPPGSGPIPHAHAEQDETFYILNGELEFLQGERTFTAHAGDLVFCPRRLRHRFHNIGVHTARMLFFYTPGGTERTFVEGGDEPRTGCRCSPGALSGSMTSSSRSWRNTALSRCRTHHETEERRDAAAAVRWGPTMPAERSWPSAGEVQSEADIEAK